MAITVIGVEKSGNNSYIGNPQSVTVNKPSGANDDLMVAVIAGYNVQYSRSGWTRIVNQAYVDNIDRRVNVLIKRMTNYAGEPSTFTFTASTYPVAQIVCFSLRGVYFADPGYQFTHIGNDYNVTRTIPGVTTLNPNTYVFYIPHMVRFDWGDSGGDPLGSWISNTGAITDVYVGAGWNATTPSAPYSSGNSFNVGFAVGYLLQAVAGLSPTTSWTRDNSYGGNSMGIALAINSEAGGGPPGCTCNAICDNDCGSNQLCTGHVPTCINTFHFSYLPSTSLIILANHLAQLESAINLERADLGRRYNASEPAYCTTHTPGNLACTANEFAGYPFGGGGVGDIILAQHWDDVKDANNEVVNDSGWGSLVTANFIAQSADVSSGKIDSVIKAVDVIELQDRINVTRNSCICDSHCNCDPSDCGCNGECPSHSYYYYP